MRFGRGVFRLCHNLITTISTGDVDPASQPNLGKLRLVGRAVFFFCDRSVVLRISCLGIRCQATRVRFSAEILSVSGQYGKHESIGLLVTDLTV